MGKKISNPPPPDNVARPAPPPNPPRPPSWQDDVDEIRRLRDALGQAQKHIEKLEEAKYAPPAIEVIDGVISDKSQDADWLRARYFEQSERIEQLETLARRMWIQINGDDEFFEDAVSGQQSAGDTLPEDDWRVYECSLCHWKIQALATNKPEQCKLCTNFSMREQTDGDSGS